jgi:hypothetical protein
MRESLPREITGRIDSATQARTVFQDFYGSYPHLNRPELFQVVYASAAELAHETGWNGAWNADFRKAVYDRTMKKLGELVVGGGAPAAPSAPQTPKGGEGRRPAQQPTQLHPATRASARGLENTVASQVVDLMRY